MLRASLADGPAFFALILIQTLILIHRYVPDAVRIQVDRGLLAKVKRGLSMAIHRMLCWPGFLHRRA